ncbi:MAG: hypothetical protein OEY49_15725 [Candidatus Heimdallarchaeota archaeon]|nr:hypothetical protein [Candidatus Heimdallarchaeota archaeon]
MIEKIIPLKLDFLKYENFEIQELCKKHKIETVYLPIDGTRRGFRISQIKISQPPEFNFQAYYEYVIPRLVELIKKFYSLGIKNLIILLMDETAFIRGKEYLSMALNLGIKPLYEDQRFLDLYKSYGICVSFEGDNDLYNKFQMSSCLNNFEKLEKLTEDNKNMNLIFYTGWNCQRDYLDVVKRLSSLEIDFNLLTEAELIKLYYKVELSTIDFSIFYGQPRDKIIPPLLWNNGQRYYSEYPSLELSIEQIKTAIYYTIKSRTNIGDSFISYDRINAAQIQQYLNKFGNNSNLWGEKIYELDTI